jgi:hypothetical protein
VEPRMIVMPPEREGEQGEFIVDKHPPVPGG